jgi:hypothetical protein
VIVTFTESRLNGTHATALAAHCLEAEEPTFASPSIVPLSEAPFAADVAVNEHATGN